MKSFGVIESGLELVQEPEEGSRNLHTGDPDFLADRDNLA